MRSSDVNPESKLLNTEQEGSGLRAKRSLVDRLRTALRIPRSIKEEVATHEKIGAFKAVEQFNNDPLRMPKIERNKSNFLRNSLVTTALGALAAVHEPQIEQAAKRAEVMVDYAMEEGRDAFGVFWNKVNSYIKRNGVSEAHATDYDRVADALHGRTQHSQNGERFKKMLRGVGDLTVDRAEAVEQIFNTHNWSIEGGRDVNYADFFLDLEYLHGNISHEQRAEAHVKIYEQIHAMQNKLSQDDKDNPVKVAFELAKQRTSYVRHKADVYSMATKGEGNCEALVRYLLATVPQVSGTQVDTAVQVFQDHVKFLVRVKYPQEGKSNPWYWIDGHSWGVLSADDLHGTTLVSPREMVQQMLGRVEPKQLVDTPLAVPEKTLGYKTNSMITWVPTDGRTPQRKASDGEVPLFVDERADAQRTFEQAAQLRERDESIQYIPVAADFFENTTHPNSAQEDHEESRHIAPTEEKVIDAAMRGFFSGKETDLSPLRGTNLRQYRSEWSTFQYGDPPDVDISPLKDSQLQVLAVENLEGARITGAETLNVKNLHTLQASLDMSGVIAKVAADAEHVESVVLSISEDKRPHAELADLMKYGPGSKFFESKAALQQITDRMVRNKKGTATIYIVSPFESYSVTWKFNTDTRTWISNIPSDYLSPDVVAGLKSIYQRGEFEIPRSVNSLDYLDIDKIDYSEIKSVIFKDTYLASDEAGGSELTIPVQELRGAKNLESATIEIGSSETLGKQLNVSVLNSLSIKHLTLVLDEDVSLEPDFKVVGAPAGTKIRIIQEGPLTF